MHVDMLYNYFFIAGLVAGNWQRFVQFILVSYYYRFSRGIRNSKDTCIVDISQGSKCIFSS
jgi:hypothetical protein